MAALADYGLSPIARVFRPMQNFEYSNAISLSGAILKRNAAAVTDDAIIGPSQTYRLENGPCDGFHFFVAPPDQSLEI